MPTGAEPGAGAASTPATPATVRVLSLVAVLVAVASRPLPASPAPAPATVAAHRGYPVVSLGALAATGAVDVERRGGEARLRVGGTGLRLRPGSPFVRVGRDLLQLANPPYSLRGDTWVPVELFRRLLPTVARGAGGWTVRDGYLLPPGTEEDVAAGPFVVVIDPGHGGVDPGTRGPRGTLEKSVTFGIARRLRERLARRDGVVPVMTRSRDTLVALRDRSRVAIDALAEEYGGREPAGGLFLSIHANAVARGTATGFETYFLSPARTEQAREVAMRENRAVRYEPEGATPDMSQLQFILADMDKSMWIRESNRLAGYTQNSMRTVHPSSDRGVKQAGFLVLVWASGSMPAVLVETGFLSDPTEERYLRSSRGQSEIADALADAVVDYQRQFRRRMTGTAAR